MAGSNDSDFAGSLAVAGSVLGQRLPAVQHAAERFGILCLRNCLPAFQTAEFSIAFGGYGCTASWMAFVRCLSNRNAVHDLHLRWMGRCHLLLGGSRRSRSQHSALDV